MRALAGDLLESKGTLTLGSRKALEFPWRTVRQHKDQWTVISSKRVSLRTDPQGCDRTLRTWLAMKIDVHFARALESPNMNSLASREYGQTRSKTLKISSDAKCVSPWLLSRAHQDRESSNSLMELLC